MTTTIATSTIRERRELLGASRLTLAIRSGVSMTWLAALEAGLHPHDSRALDRVLAALDELERDAA
jgi:transcriptional regulator with XRE-family HTH domain